MTEDFDSIISDWHQTEEDEGVMPDPGWFVERVEHYYDRAALEARQLDEVAPGSSSKSLELLVHMIDQYVKLAWVSAQYYGAFFKSCPDVGAHRGLLEETPHHTDT